MNENIEVIELEEVEFDYKEVSNIGRTKDSPVWIYLAKLTPESFVRLWQRCGSMEQFQASYQALGGGTCSLECEDSETLPEESVSKILFTAGILRKRGVPLKSWDVTEDTKSDYWDTLSQLAEEEAL
jgi:hypothetical protein|tara:strand:- start:2600 stop:2980 length:381 start_codon:yes stop_codon:yes gene_type:complete